MARRWRGRLDGLSLVAGTMAPDLAYVLWLTPLSFDSHALVALLWWSVPVAVVLATVTRRWIIGPLAAIAPDLGSLHVRDYRFVAVRRPSLLVSALSAWIGALTHVALDAFTHRGGWAVARLPVLRDEIAIGGVAWPVYSWMQRAGGVLMALGALALLVVYGRRRWLLPPDGRVKEATPFPAEAIGRRLHAGALVGAAAGAAIFTIGWPVDGAIAAFMRVVWVAFVALAVSLATIPRPHR